MNDLANLLLTAAFAILTMIAVPDIAAWINGTEPITFGSTK